MQERLGFYRLSEQQWTSNQISSIRDSLYNFVSMVLGIILGIGISPSMVSSISLDSSSSSLEALHQLLKLSLSPFFFVISAVVIALFLTTRNALKGDLSMILKGSENGGQCTKRRKILNAEGLFYIYESKALDGMVALNGLDLVIKEKSCCLWSKWFR